MCLLYEVFSCIRRKNVVIASQNRKDNVTCFISIATIIWKTIIYGLYLLINKETMLIWILRKFWNLLFDFPRFSISISVFAEESIDYLNIFEIIFWFGRIVQYPTIFWVNVLCLLFWSCCEWFHLFCFSPNVFISSIIFLKKISSS